MALFRDRVDAGQALAQKLESYRAERPLVLGLARGGVVLAHEIAESLGCDMDLLVVRKVGAPHHPEYGIGAVAPGGISIFDPDVLARLHLSEKEFDLLAARELREVERRLLVYRGASPEPVMNGRFVILTDDGLATGGTALAAARYVRTQKPERLILAVPVCTRQARALLSTEVDEIVCLEEPEPFYAVGQWYQDFDQVEDEQVLDLLSQRR